ncbi:FUC1, partial [Symbiodinium microadriaticum]
ESGGLFKSTDGGKSWRKITNGLAQGSNGQIDISLHRANPDIMVMAYEADENIPEDEPGTGVYRSDDGGENWKHLLKHAVRPFYHGQIEIDPINPDNIYVVSRGFMFSTDGGKTFEDSRWRKDGGDDHDMWIAPYDNKIMYAATDQGAKLTIDGGENWLSFNNMAIGQYYAIGVDMRDPYWVIGGLQDNGLWMTPSNSREVRGILNEHSTHVGEGDGFHAQVDPENWRTHYIVNHVGDSWSIISPDLTTNDPELRNTSNGGGLTNSNTGGENHFTIITISISPFDENIVWVGTDDGLIHVTTDGGVNWTNVKKNIPGAPDKIWVSRIEAGHHDKGTCYVTLDNHRFDDNKAYVYKTTDFGETWTDISGNLTDKYSAYVIREDYENPNLLFVGTEETVHASIDGGKSWSNIRSGLPTVAIHDLIIHPREGDLVAGTHGRSIWIMDDISPLRQYSNDIATKSLHLFDSKVATKWLGIYTGINRTTWNFSLNRTTTEIDAYRDKIRELKKEAEEASDAKAIMNGANGVMSGVMKPCLPIHHWKGNIPFQMRHSRWVSYCNPLVIKQAPRELVDKYRRIIGDEEPYPGGKGYFPCRYPRATYAAMIEYLDQQVGDLMAKLDELGLSENTLIIFSSDNGPTYNTGGVDPHFFNSAGPFNTGRGWGKGYVHEGGLRVPMIANWPGKIEPQSSSDLPSAFWDVLPTIADIVNTSVPASVDGISFLPTLLGQENQRLHDYLYWEFPSYGGQQAIRMGQWKAVRKNMQDTIAITQLYDLGNDIREENDVSKSNPEILEKVESLFLDAHTTSEEWGFGDESEAIFDPTELDTRQWARVAKETGMEGLILTAKHHDGFCLWPTSTTEHSVANSPWKNGEGDVVRELQEACEEYGIKLGIYLSPWDRNHSTYSSPEYIEIYRTQMRELLSSYGEIFEFWFDGANGGDGFYGGANEMRKIDNRTYYDWPNSYKIVRELQPMAVMFSDGGPDVRWIGNERGYAGETNWSKAKSNFFYAGIGGVNDQLQAGHPDGNTWLPAEVNTSIRPGWFYHPEQDSLVKSVKQLADNWMHSVGMNGNFLLNIPPDARGLFHENDVQRLYEFKEWREASFSKDYMEGASIKATGERGKNFNVGNTLDSDSQSYFATSDGITATTLEIQFDEPQTIDAILLQEYIPLGQRITGFRINSVTGKLLGEGTTVGNRRIARIPEDTYKGFTIEIEALAPVTLSNIEAYNVMDFD